MMNLSYRWDAYINHSQPQGSRNVTEEEAGKKSKRKKIQRSAVTCLPLDKTQLRYTWTHRIYSYLPIPIAEKLLIGDGCCEGKSLFLARVAVLV